MAGSARYTALLDACVLYPAPVRDLLLSLARVGLYHSRWSVQIQQEWMHNLLKNRTDLTADQLQRTCTLMNQAIPDCIIEHYEPLIESIQLPDPNDRHVLAAAIKGHADAIVTFNLKDFPAETLNRYDIEAQHPDDFVLNQIELHEITALATIKEMRLRLKNPQQSAEELIATFERCGLPSTSTWLRRAVRLI